MKINIKNKIPIKKRRGLDFNRRRTKRDISGLKGGLILTVEILLSIGLGFLVAFSFFTSVGVSGVSMEPSLMSGDRVLINRAATLVPIKAGDVVAFYSGSGQNKTVNIKRVAGVPGDTLSISSGNLLVNGVKEEFKNEPVTIEEPGVLRSELTLEKGEYFLLGDNRNNSEDSRFESIGTISKSNIIGGVWIDLTPTNFGPIRSL